MVVDEDGCGVLAVVHHDDRANASAGRKERDRNPPGVRCLEAPVAAGRRAVCHCVCKVWAGAMAGVFRMDEVMRPKQRVGPHITHRGVPRGPAVAPDSRHMCGLPAVGPGGKDSRSRVSALIARPAALRKAAGGTGHGTHAAWCMRVTIAPIAEPAGYGGEEDGGGGRRAAKRAARRRRSRSGNALNLRESEHVTEEPTLHPTVGAYPVGRPSAGSRVAGAASRLWRRRRFPSGQGGAQSPAVASSRGGTPTRGAKGRSRRLPTAVGLNGTLRGSGRVPLLGGCVRLRRTDRGPAWRAARGPTRGGAHGRSPGSGAWAGTTGCGASGWRPGRHLSVGQDRRSTSRGRLAPGLTECPRAPWGPPRRDTGAPKQDGGAGWKLE